MLPNDDFLRHLPVAISAVDRLRLETLVFAHDLMEIAYGRLCELGLIFNEEHKSDYQRVAMFGDAWTIVDQVHVVRQVLLSLTGADRKADTLTFISDFSAAQSLRNKMDHLNQNIPNRAKSKVNGNALFGQLSFFRPFPDRWDQGLQEGEIRGELMVISAGAMPDPMLGGVAFDDLDIHLPICSFKLEAFDQSLLLERAVNCLRALLMRLSNDTKLQFAHMVDEITGNGTLTREELLRSTSGHIVLRMECGLQVQPGLGSLPISF